MKTKIAEYFKSRKIESTVKYIDPSYMIRYLEISNVFARSYVFADDRSVPANAADSVYCMMLGQNAVHAAMSGLTGFTVGLVNNRMVLIPIPVVVATSPRTLDPEGRTWERVVTLTRQPTHLFKDNKPLA